jgi:hypothetical protein
MPPLDVCRHRLASQHLVKQTLETASEVVRLFGAVQAQDYSGAKWGIGQRTIGANDATIEKEFSDGAILRTHVLRPTWHFVAPADIRWMLALTAPRVKAAMAHYDRKLELDAAVLRRSQKVLTKALTGGKELIRTELARALTKAGVPADGTQRLAHLVMHAELDGLICSGARRGKQFTYALLEERVPRAKMLDRDAALHELAIRYFPTRGPATEDDFAWWSGLRKGDAKAAVHSAESSLDSEIIGGRKYWFRRSAVVPRVKSPFARLLPNFDEYFIGLKDRGSIQLKVADIKQSMALLGQHIATIDGQIVGGWTRSLEGKSVAVTLRTLTPLTTSDQRAIASEAIKFAAFLGLEGRLELESGLR